MIFPINLQLYLPLYYRYQQLQVGKNSSDYLLGGTYQVGEAWESWATGELGHPRYHSNVKQYAQVLLSNESTIHYLLFAVTSLSSPCSVKSLCQEINYIEKCVNN